MDVKKIVAHSIAIMVICLNAIGTSSTNKSHVIKLNGICNSLSSAQYILLSAYTGCTGCILAIVRNIIFQIYNEKGKKVPLWTLITYIVFTLLINIPLYNSWFAIIPIFNIGAYAYGIWQENIGTQKKFTMLIGITGLIYNLCNQAYISVINSSIDFLGGLTGLIKYKKKAKEA